MSLRPPAFCITWRNQWLVGGYCSRYCDQVNSCGSGFTANWHGKNCCCPEAHCSTRPWPVRGGHSALPPRARGLRDDAPLSRVVNRLDFSAPAAAATCCSMFKNINLRCQRLTIFSRKTTRVPGVRLAWRYAAKFPTAFPQSRDNERSGALAYFRVRESVSFHRHVPILDTKATIIRSRDKSLRSRSKRNSLFWRFLNVRFQG